MQGDDKAQQRASNDERRTISVFQIDYAHPMSIGNRIETGFKTVLRNFDNDYTFETLDDTWINDPSISNRFLYKEQVHAFYLTYSQKLGRLNFTLGNRLEQSIINTTQYALNERHRLSYLNFFPSGSLQYKLNQKQDIRFTYSRRIDRPGAWRLNPFPDIADSLNIRTGNPKLQPEYIQSFELGQHISLEKIDLTTTLFHRHTSGIVDYIITVDENGISHGRPENLTSGNDTGLEVISTSNIAPWWNVSASFSIFRRSVDGSNINQDFTNENIAWNTKMVSDFSLPWDLKLQLNFNYASEEVEAQGIDFARYSLDGSLSKSFLDKKITASISVRDIFDTRRYGGTSFGEDFYQERIYKPQSRLVFHSIGIKL